MWLTLAPVGHLPAPHRRHRPVVEPIADAMTAFVFAEITVFGIAFP
jgi:hypothetical protein